MYFINHINIILSFDFHWFTNVKTVYSSPGLRHNNLGKH